MPSDLELGAGKTCFVVSPIGDKFAPIGTPARQSYEDAIVMWESVFQPACAQFGMEPVRADKISEPGEIPDQVFNYLHSADVVIADVSKANPNVMYELGLRHTRPLVTVQIGEYEQLPFDVATIRTIKFRRTEAGLIEARQNLIETLRAGLSGQGAPLRPTAVWSIGGSANAAAVAEDVAASLVPDDNDLPSTEPGFLDILAEGEESLTHISEVLTQATAETTSIATLVGDAATSMTQSDASGGGFGARLSITRELATALVGPGDQLESLANDFYIDVTKMDAMIDYIVTRAMNPVPGEDLEPEVSENFATSTLGFVDSADEGAVGITTFRENLRAIRSSSRLLVGPTRTLERAANRFLEAYALIGSWRGPLESIGGTE
jgi:hypothetical protein